MKYEVKKDSLSKLTAKIIIILLAMTSIVFSQQKDSLKVVVKDLMKTPIVTFVELGSTNCIPCRQMQPIMKAIEEEYPTQVKVEFIDVWTTKGKIDGRKYNVRLIPTQVFLDSLGKEYYRHEGFFPKDKLIEVLKKKGVK